MKHCKEYSIHIRIKNNLLLAAILKEWQSVGAFCKANGFQPTAVGEFINLKKSGKTRSGAWRILPEKIAVALRALPEDLFSEAQQTQELKSNSIEVEISESEALAIVDERNSDPALNYETRNLIAYAIKDCTEREREVLTAVILEEEPISQVAKRYGMSNAGIGVIRDGALEKMGKRLIRERRLIQ